ncbi:DNA polymerase I [Mycoplasmatota bacterium]|nr:DNA polymerase I [Mycoplasmatota bacterium]
MKKITLIDGNSVMFRAYYATAYPGAKLMQSSKGVYTNALFAFVSMFEKIVTEDSTNVLVAFDTKEPTKRHLKYDQYKAGRVKMPEELGQQIPMIYDYIKLDGVKLYFKAGYEADDIIGTIAKQASDKGYQVDIYSSDRDLLQLVNDYTTVHLLKRGMQEVDDYTPKKMFEKYELSHEQFIDLKALMGDSSDNIPGVPGVGEKTGIKLLKQYGTLENIYAHSDEIKGKLGEKIRDNKELAFMSKDLATIILDADIDIDVDHIKKEEPDQGALIKFFQNFDLHMFVKKMEQPKVVETWEPIEIKTDKELKKVLTSGIAVHFEFSDYNYHKSDLWGVGISNGKNHYFLDPLFVMHSEVFTDFLLDEKQEKYVYDYKALKVFLMWQLKDIEGVTFDLLIAAYLINSHLGKEEFKRIVAAFDYEDMQYDEQVYGKGAKKGLPLKEFYLKHVASKAKAIFSLRDEMLKTLKDQEQLELFNDVEMPLCEVLANMEYEGLTVDLEELDKQGTLLQSRIKTIEENIIELAGEKFSVSSPKQLGIILFEKLELPYAKKTKTGYSTNVDVLNKLKDKHPIINLILEFRQLSKLYSTYIVGIKQNVFDDGKVHTIYMQALTTTGRLSSLDPNLQNIPIRSQEGREIRKLFVPKADMYLLGADYSQIELRVLADVADVKQLIEAFNHHEDIHTKTAKAIFDKDEVDSEMRRAAKAVNFGIIYGIGAWSLSEDIHVSPKEAQKFIDEYLNLYPEIKQYMLDIVEFAKAHGYVKTIMNRRRYIPELTSSVFMQRAFGERTALNAPIQGSAADILKKAMIDLYKYLKKHKKQSKILLQVHDELILQVPEHELEEMKEIVPKMMGDAVKMKVKLETSCDIGRSWYELK